MRSSTNSTSAHALRDAPPRHRPECVWRTCAPSRGCSPGCRTVTCCRRGTASAPRSAASWSATAAVEIAARDVRRVALVARDRRQLPHDPRQVRHAHRPPVRLVSDATIRDRIFGLIEAEYAAACTAVLAIVNQTDLLADKPYLRAPSSCVTPTSTRCTTSRCGCSARSEPPGPDGRAPPSNIRSLLTVSGIAAGLRNTG